MKKCIRILCFVLLAASASAWAQLTGTTVATNRVLVAPSTSTSWTDILVTCPSGMVALSGGVDSSAFNFIEATTLAPTFGGAALVFQADGTRNAPDGWYASVKNYDTAAHTVAAVVTCATLSGVVTSVSSGVVSSGTAATPGNGSAVANCPSGYAGLGGGTDLDLPASMKLSSSAPIFDFQYLIDRPAGQGTAPTGWVANVRSEGAAGTMKVAAICAQLGGVFAVGTGAFSVNSGTAAGFSAVCPAGSMTLGGGIDTNDITRNVIAVSTPFFGAAPQFPVDRDTGNYASAGVGWYGIYFNYGPDRTTASVGVVCAQPTPNVILVYEFFNTGLKHYFRTASLTEAAAIDGGSAGPNWTRTGDNFYAFAPGSNSAGADVCRFYTFGANSHFYTAFTGECASLKAPGSGWVYEGLSFRIPLPAGTACATGTKPVYRLYNNRFAFNDSNHRFTSQVGNIAPLQAQGWTYEGVAFCALDL
ncbi:MAG: hypothetical protein ABI831_03430 [Betaproteobacteria bacterium]